MSLNNTAGRVCCSGESGSMRCASVLAIDWAVCFMCVVICFILIVVYRDYTIIYEHEKEKREKIFFAFGVGFFAVAICFSECIAFAKVVLCVSCCAGATRWCAQRKSVC